MQCRGPKSEEGTRHPACREFMDDLIMITSSIQFMNLTKNTFSIQGSEIPTQERGIRCFGKNYESSLKDIVNFRDTKAQLGTWLKATAWMVQLQCLSHRVQWRPELPIFKTPSNTLLGLSWTITKMVLVYKLPNRQVTQNSRFIVLIVKSVKESNWKHDMWKIVLENKKQTVEAVKCIAQFRSFNIYDSEQSHQYWWFRK